MDNKIFDAITGKVSTGSPLITAPGGSCEDAINVVFPQSGIAWNRQGHSVFGPIDPSIDNTTPNPTLTDWGYINQYPYPDARYTSRINSWRALNANFRYNINNLTNTEGVISSKPVLPGLKVDRYEDYGDYNPKEGFSDAVIEVNESSGSSMLGWIGNNGRVEGFSNNNSSSDREDLYRYVKSDQTYGKVLTRVGPMFSSSWLNSFFDSCVTVQDYRFIDFGQNRLVMADSNKWLRVIQPRDTVTGYKTAGVLVQRSANDDFTTPNEPARCWKYSPREKVTIPAWAARYKSDSSGWLQDGYAVDMFAVLKFTDETGAFFYGPPSQIVTCKNFRQGNAIALVAPQVDMANCAHLAKQVTLEVYRTKQYKWFGTNTEQPPTVFYLCFSERGDSFYSYSSGTKYGKYNNTWSVTASFGSNASMNSATEPFIKGEAIFSSGFFTITSSAIDITSKSKTLLIKYQAGLQARGFPTTSAGLYYIGHTVRANSSVAVERIVLATSRDTPYEVVVPVQDLSNLSITPSIKCVHEFDSFSFPAYPSVNTPVVTLTVPEVYGAIELTLADASLIDVWSEGIEYSTQDTFPLVAGYVSFRGRVIGYNAVLPPTAYMNQVKFSSDHIGITGTQIIQENTSDTYASGAFLLNLSRLTAETLIDYESDWLYQKDMQPRVADLGSGISSLSYRAIFSGSADLSKDNSSFLVSELQQKLSSVAFDSVASTLTVKTSTTEASWQSISATGVVLLWKLSSNVYDFTSTFSLFDVVAYGSITETYSGGVRTIVFNDAVSLHAGSYSSPDPITAQTVFATLLQASGATAVPVWLTDKGYACGRGLIRYSGYSVLTLPTAPLLSEPTGFISAATTSGTTRTGWTYLANPDTEPTISTMEVQTVQYQAVTAASLMSQALRSFANDLDRKTTYKVIYNTYDPLKIGLQKTYFGSEGNGTGRTNNSNLTIGYNQYTPNSAQIFDESLNKAPTAFSDLAPISTHVPNAVVFSKPNRYDVCDSLGNVLKIGDDNKPITNIVEFNGALYVFKEEEGIYRLIVDESNTFTSSVTLIDNTHWMISNRSVQLVMDGLYFVSNRGISLLTASESVIDISDGIHQEVATYIADVAANADLGTHPQERMARISSYANEARRLYAVHFPRCGTHKRGVTLVYSGNTNQWSKSDQRFEASWTVQDKTYTIEPVYSVDGNGDDTMTREATLFKKDNVSSDLYAVADQHDGYFSTAEVRYVGTDTPQYKYDAVNGTVQVIDNRALPTTTTDGSSLYSFYSANKDKYVYITLFGTEYKASFVSYTSATVPYVTLQLITSTYPAYPTPFVKAVTLTAGICASMTFNPFFVAENQGKARFFEGFVTSRGSCKGVQLAFKTSSVTSWTASCTIGQTAEVFRTFVPRQATIGRWIQLKAEHSQPREFFKPYSIGYWFRPFVQGNKSTRNLEA